MQSQDTSQEEKDQAQLRKVQKLGAKGEVIKAVNEPSNKQKSSCLRNKSGPEVLKLESYNRTSE